jgi:hypothetical protein
MIDGGKQDYVFGVNRIRSEFVDDLGNVKSGTGSGFWIRSNSGRLCFVTNRHNIDPSLKYPGAGLALTKLSLELRRFDEPGRFAAETQFFDLSEQLSKCVQGADFDCAIIDPEGNDIPPNFKPFPAFNESDLADQQFFEQGLRISDPLSFIGFAGRKGPQYGDKPANWWDEVWNTPIARIAFVASLPLMPFSNVGIPTNDVMVVSGLSFSGSSGSPAIAHEKLFSETDSSGRHILKKIPSRLVGIMSGHWWDHTSTPPEFLAPSVSHSGISYLTRSTSILALLKSLEEHSTDAGVFGFKPSNSP